MTISPARRERSNNFGALRLLFATLVIVSHSPELIDGDRSRELLTRAFGTMSFGEVAVDSFFLVSGYLISMSFAKNPSTLSYFEKRVGRIAPGFLVAFSICFFVIAPFVGASVSPWSAAGVTTALSQALRLSPPDLPNTFPGLPYPGLNGAMWTIAYEFRCYVVVAILGSLAPHLPKARMLLVAGVTACLVLSAFSRLSLLHIYAEAEFGTPYNDIRFFAAFGVGSIFYVFRDRIPLTKVGCGLAIMILLPSMYFYPLAGRVFLLCGGYIIFSMARAREFYLFAWTNRTDVSYGLYLYAWPIQNLLIWSHPGMNPWVLCAVTIVLAALSGFASWTLIERPALSFLQSRSPIWGRTLTPQAEA